MRKIRIHGLLALLLIVSLLLSACGKQEEEESKIAFEPKFESAEGLEEKTLLWGDLLSGGSAVTEKADAPQYYDCLAQEMSLYLYTDGTGVIVRGDGYEYQVTYTTDESEITVVGTENQVVEEGVVQADGSLWFEDADTLFVPVDTPAFVPGEESSIPEKRVFDGTKYSMSFVLYGDGTGVVSDAEGSDDVTYTQEGDVLTVTIPSEDVTFTGVLQEDGSLYIEAVDDTFVPVEEPGFVPSAPVDADWTVENTYPYHLKGRYQHWSNTAYWLEFDGEGSVTYTLETGSGSGAYRYDGEDLEIAAEDGTVMTGDVDYEEDLWIDGHGGWFVSQRDNFFKEYNYDPNWETGSNYSLPDSARYFNDNGSLYDTAGADWRIWEERITDNGDGTRTAEIVVGCGFRYDERPDPGTHDSHGCTYDIFDAYTGYELVGDAFYNSASGTYDFDFTQNGERVSISYTVKPEWLDESQFEDWGASVDNYEDYLLIRLTITLPTDYDGLRIVAMRCDATFEQYSTRKNAQTLQPLAEEHLYMVDEGLIYKMN